jgi:hypothetical protein
MEKNESDQKGFGEVNGGAQFFKDRILEKNADVVPKSAEKREAMSLL